MKNRKNKIIELLQCSGEVSLIELKEVFPDVSEMTLRRDLESLDRERLLVRVHGGARSISSIVGLSEDVYDKRSIENAQKKDLIVKKALQLFSPKTCIFLDSGSTATALSRLVPDEDFLIYTSGITCALELARLKLPQLYLCGNRINKTSLSTYSPEVLEQLAHVNFDIAFLGVTGFMPKVGFTTGMLDEKELKRTVISRAKKVVLLMDASKVGKVFPYTFAIQSDIDVLISDDELSPEIIKGLHEKGVEVL